MEKPAIKADARSSKTKHSVKEIRKAGYVPGVIYGKKAGNIPILLLEKDLNRLGSAQLIEVKLSDTAYPAVIREIQKHPITGRILHVDFLQVEMDQKMRAQIPIQLVGTAAGQKDGGVIQHGERVVEVEALPSELPDIFEVDISHLEIGDKLTVADLQKITPLTITSDPDSFIVIVNAPRMEEEPSAEEAGPEAPSGEDAGKGQE